MQVGWFALPLTHFWLSHCRRGGCWWNLEGRAWDAGKRHMMDRNIAHNNELASPSATVPGCRSLSVLCSSLQFSPSVMSDSLRLHELQHARPPCPSPTPRDHTNSCPSSRWCHPTISSSVVPFSSCPQSLPASESFPMSHLFAWEGQSIRVSALASVLPMNTQDWSPLEQTGWISLQSKGLSRVFSNTTVQKHQFFCAQLSL